MNTEQNADSNKKRSIFSRFAGIKRRYIYAGAAAACLIIAAAFMLSLDSAGVYKTADYVAENTAVSQAAPKTAAVYDDEIVQEEAEMMVAGDSDYYEGESYMADAAGTSEGLDYTLSKASASINSASEQSQKIIKTASYDIETVDFDKIAAGIQSIVNASGGYVESFNSYIYNSVAAPDGTKDLKSGNICIKVPVSEYSDTKIKIERLGKILSVSESMDNITSQYVDLSARLEAKKSEEERLLSLIGKADKIEDLISLETRLSYVRSDIESMTSQIKNWDRNVSFSTINLSITEILEYNQIRNIDPTLSEKIVQAFNRSAVNFTYNVERLIVKLAENSIAILIFGLILLFGMVIVGRMVKKRRNKDEEKNI